jgi:deoxyribonuclease V
MKIKPLHSWDLTPTEAVALQRQLASWVDCKSRLTKCELVAGADVSHALFSNTIYAGVVVLRIDDFSIVEKQGATCVTAFPYVPGLLSFRETPALLEAFAKLETKPDLVMIDGHGMAHPRRFGFASHIGVWLGLPTVGCAKSRLLGEYDEPALAAGSVSPLEDRGEVIGQVVRTRDGVKPIFVSVGNKIDLPTAVRLTARACDGYRIPEPTRQAHLYVNEVRRKAGQAR